MPRHRTTCECRQCDLVRYMRPYYFWAWVIVFVCLGIVKIINEGF